MTFTLLPAVDVANGQAVRLIQGEAGTESDFRFELAIANGLSGDPIREVLEAEQIGFDVAVIGDHVGLELAPLPTLAAIAGATTSIRIGTNVLNADVRNPVQPAWEAATLDRLSSGRFELGLGAGHTPQEYVAMGLPQDPPELRKRRLARRRRRCALRSHGTIDEIADKLERCRDRWGITYFVVRNREQFAPVIARLRDQRR